MCNGPGTGPAGKTLWGLLAALEMAALDRCLQQAQFDGFHAALPDACWPIPNPNRTGLPRRVQNILPKERSSTPVDLDKLLADLKEFANYYCAMALGREPEPSLAAAFRDIQDLKVDTATRSAGWKCTTITAKTGCRSTKFTDAVDTWKTLPKGPLLHSYKLAQQPFANAEQSTQVEGQVYREHAGPFPDLCRPTSPVFPKLTRSSRGKSR